MQQQWTFGAPAGASKAGGGIKKGFKTKVETVNMASWLQPLYIAKEPHLSLPPPPPPAPAAPLACILCPSPISMSCCSLPPYLPLSVNVVIQGLAYVPVCL